MHIKYNKTLFKYLCNKVKRFLGTSILALFFLVASYIFTNLDLALVDDNEVLKWLKLAQYELFGDDDAKECPDSILLINTCYDNSLLDVLDSYGRPMGTIKITDREKLYKLLKIISFHDNYKYIMLDVGFTTQEKTEYDDSLYQMIAKMKNIVLSKLDTLPIDHRIKDKCYNSSYKVSAFNTDCIKIPLFHGNEKSMPYKAFEDLTGRSISCLGPFYFEKGHLARKSIYPNYSFIFHKQFSNDELVFADESMFYNIGSGILNQYNLEQSKELFANKIIVIGDFDDDKDLHQTYVGTLAGPLIHLNVLTSLMDNAHQIPYYLLILLYIIFFLISDNLLYKRHLPSVDESQRFFRLSNSLSKSIIPITILSSYYSILLIILCALIYIITGQAYDVLFTGVLIGLVHWIIRIINQKHLKK